MYGCPYRISAMAVNVPAIGGTVDLQLTGECTWTWTAESENAFLKVTSKTSGNGTGIVTLAAAANTGPPRTGRLKIAGYTVAVTQAGS